MGILRLLLAISVLSNHSSPLPVTGNSLVGGVVAVQSFFIISGFYMALVLNQGYGNLRDFYFNRFLRLFPAYWAVLALTVLLHWALNKPDFVANILASDVLRLDGKVFMLAANITMAGSDTMMFLYPGTGGLNFTTDFRAHGLPMLYQLHAVPQVWSLPLEIAFYILAPLLVRTPARLAAAFVASLLVRYAVYKSIGSHDPWSYRFFPNELAFFCAGSLAYHAYTCVRSWPLARGLGVLLLTATVVYIANFTRIPGLPGTGFLYPGALQFYAGLVLALPFIFVATEKIHFDQWIGELSYPVYIAHWGVIQNAQALPKPTGIPVYDTLVITLTVAILLNAALQTPLEARFKRSSRPRV